MQDAEQLEPPRAHSGVPAPMPSLATTNRPTALLTAPRPRLATNRRYPTTVATLSRRARDVVEQSFERTSDQGRGSPLIESRLQVGGLEAWDWGAGAGAGGGLGVELRCGAWLALRFGEVGTCGVGGL